MNLMKVLLKSIGRPIMFTAIGGLVALGAAHSLGWTGKTVIIEDTNQGISHVNWTADPWAWLVHRQARSATVRGHMGGASRGAFPRGGTEVSVHVKMNLLECDLL